MWQDCHKGLPVNNISVVRRKNNAEGEELELKAWETGHPLSEQLSMEFMVHSRQFKGTADVWHRVLGAISEKSTEGEERERWTWILC